MPHALVIMDGWGIAPNQAGNAITAARTPNLNKLKEQFAYTELAASGRAVGLPEGQDGNSEAGHTNIGAGRVVPQEALLINFAISSGVFFKNPAFLEAVHHVEKNKSKLHLMGMLANRMSAHAYPDHLEALLLFCKKKGIQVYLHLFTDGRDAPQHEAINLLKNLQDHFLDGEIIATIMGRSYAMERNKRWEITEQAYDCLVLGRGESVPSAEEAISRSYNRNETDEFIKPHVIDPKGLIADNDAVIFFNLRSDRARQITKCFVQEKDFNQRNPGSFQRKKVLHNLKFIAMTDFGPDLDSVLSAFPSPDLHGTLPEAMQSMRQLYVAESEKYAHITYFLNGGNDHPVENESWEKVPSPADPNYLHHPEMGAVSIVDTVVQSIQNRQHDFYAINFANADMLGHTGNLEATVKGVEVIDQQIGRLWEALQVADANSILFITADHGNAEEMINIQTKEIDTEHSTYLVPFIITKSGLQLKSGGSLANVVPTLLKVLNVPKPNEMTAEPLC